MAKDTKSVHGTSVADVVSKTQEDMGDGIAKIGGEWEDLERIPTGLFEFDIATGGGFPKNKISLIYGNESSTKTVHAILAIAAHQRLWPDKVCAYIALEGYGGSDREWFKALGVDVDKLAVFRPVTAEQVVDIMDSFCWANDAGLAVIDSLAVIMTTTEFENSAEKKSFGGSSIPITTMARKINAAMNASPAQPTVIYINQPRTKIGVMYGDPTSLPGGNLVNKFQPNMIVKLYGKNEMDPKHNKVLPVRKAVTMTLNKWKVPILSQAAEYDIAMVPHKGLRVGTTDWFNSFKTYARALGILTKDKDGYHAFEQTWAKLDDMKKDLYADPEVASAIIAELIDVLRQNGTVIEAQEDDDGDA